MQFLNYSNTAPPRGLSAGVNDTATTLTVSSTAGYPAAPFLLGLERGTANEEVVLVTATTGTTFTVTRGYDGTTAKAHGTGTLVEHTVSALVFRGSGIVRITTTVRDGLSGDNLWTGRVIYNETDGQVQYYNGSIWVAVGAGTDHNSLANLTSGDPHTQYVPVNGARAAAPLRVVRSSVDANGIFTVVEYHRVGGNRAIRSVLSGGTSPAYTTRTVTEYGLDGTTVIRTITYTNTYTSGALTSEAAVIS